MAKFHGVIGFVKTVEIEPGVWEEQAIERSYSGELLKNTRSLQTSDSINDNINISNDISVIADPYAELNFHDIRYAIFRGTKWKITNVDVQYPRLRLTMGGVYNGK